MKSGDDSWSIEPATVPAGYVCPVCELGRRTDDPEALQLEFGLWPAVFPEPMCEGCFRLLPHLMSYVPGELIYPPRTLLVRLADMLGLPDERILIVRYTENSLAELGGTAGFEGYLAKQRSYRPRLPRRKTKKAWRRMLVDLERKIHAVRAQILPSVAKAWLS